MPELPEVLTITKDLKKEVLNKKVVKIETYSKYLLRPNKELFAKAVINSKVTEIGNIAKLIYLKFSSNYYIAIHLNMTGRLLYNTKDPYIKVALEFEKGDKLYYSSVRMFGYFEVWNEEKIQEYKGKYGPTALDKKLTAKRFMERIQKKNTYIKNALLDQKLISGIGNIYANDALFLSKISPNRKTGDISFKEFELLLKNVQLLLKEGIKNRGSSIDRYTDLYGKPGNQQKYFRVYGKKGQKCPSCKKTLTFEKLGGRGTFYCPNCQK